MFIRGRFNNIIIPVKARVGSDRDRPAKLSIIRMKFVATSIKDQVVMVLIIRNCRLVSRVFPDNVLIKLTARDMEHVDISCGIYRQLIHQEGNRNRKRNPCGYDSFKNIMLGIGILFTMSCKAR